MKNVRDFMNSMIVLIIVLAVIGYFVVGYFEDRYGEGVSGIISLIIFGIGIAIGIMMIYSKFIDRATTRVNETHAAAGQDFTELFHGLSGPISEVVKAIGTSRKGQDQRALVADKLEADKERTAFKFEDFLRRGEEKEARKAAEQKKREDRERAEFENAWNWGEGSDYSDVGDDDRFVD